jgi:argininosuccinate lyase
MSSNMSNKLWQGRTGGDVDPLTEQINRSIRFDQRLYPYDIAGSLAHARMLGQQGIISEQDAQQIVDGLTAIRNELDAGTLSIDLTAEDIHTFVEMELTRRIGEAGKKLHTGRSRNDQVALDLRLFLRDHVQQIQTHITTFQQALKIQADQHRNTVMPGYTHLQPAQPITFAMHLEAYIAMLDRDHARLSDCLSRINLSPLGAGALAGSTFPLDRQAVADALGFAGVLWNPLDAVSSRDFVLETLSALSILMSHLSRLAEEIILWNSQAFSFVRLNDAHTTGSSMMPQKKNPDVAELVRGKTGRVCGHLMSLLTVMKALPLAYNKDMQEDKEAVFDAVDTVLLCLAAMTVMMQGLQANPNTMRSAAQQGFINATDLADYLVRKGLSFREAYALVGQIVAHCIENGCTLEALPLEQYSGFSPVFGSDLYTAISLESCLQARRQASEK